MFNAAGTSSSGRIAKGRSSPILCAGNEKNDTPLHSAIRSFDDDTSPVKILLEKHGDRDINARNSEGETPLLVAVQNKRCSENLIELLLDHGADVKATTPRDGNTALHWSCAFDTILFDYRYAVNQILLQRGSDPNAKNLEGCIPLHYAVHNDDSLIHLLINFGSDVSTRNFKGDTPVHLYLQQSSSCNYADSLIEKILDVNVVNCKGETLLHVAARNENPDNVWSIIFLLSQGVDGSIKDALGENAYQAYCRAADEGNRTADPTMQMILQGKKYVNSSLHVACIFHNVDSVQRLLRLGADVNGRDTLGLPPLYYASFATGDNSDKRSATLRLLFDFGAHINHRIDILEILSPGLAFRHAVMAVNLLGMSYKGHLDPYLFVAKLETPIDLNIFYQHMVKLLKLEEKQIERGINVEGLRQFNHGSAPKRAERYEELANFVKEYKNWISCCSEELKTMSDTKIGESRVTFLDLLILADAKETAIHAKNKELVKAFDAKKAMFPMYQGMLDAKLARDLERQRLVESAAVSLSNALKFADPSDEFFMRTLSYCSNNDLINVIDALDETE